MTSDLILDVESRNVFERKLLHLWTFAEPNLSQINDLECYRQGVDDGVDMDLCVGADSDEVAIFFCDDSRNGFASFTGW